MNFPVQTRPTFQGYGIDNLVEYSSTNLSTCWSICSPCSHIIWRHVRIVFLCIQYEFLIIHDRISTHNVFLLHKFISFYDNNLIKSYKIKINLKLENSHFRCNFFFSSCSRPSVATSIINHLDWIEKTISVSKWLIIIGTVFSVFLVDNEHDEPYELQIWFRLLQSGPVSCFVNHYNSVQSLLRIY